jgi:hypothetical protein
VAAEVRLATQTSDAEHPFAFRPAEVTVRAGQAVRWVDDDAVFHTVTSTDRLEPRQPNGRFDASLFRRGQSFTFTFRRPGRLPLLLPPARRVHVRDGARDRVMARRGPPPREDHRGGDVSGADARRGRGVC